MRAVLLRRPAAVAVGQARLHPGEVVLDPVGAENSISLMPPALARIRESGPRASRVGAMALATY